MDSEHFGSCSRGVKELKTLLLFSFAALTLPQPASCIPEAEYQIFQGFDLNAWTEASQELEDDSVSVPLTDKRQKDDNVTNKTWSMSTEPVIFGNTSIMAFKSGSSCPEEEKPSNMGPYEIPTQRDLVLLTRKTLHRMFGSYHEKAMMFLEDIMKATRATEEVANKCMGNKLTYRKCVKHVSSKCETITKSLTTSLELQRQDVVAFGKKKICTLADMKEDPVKLIKILASEEASLEFALPGFLRLLNACSVYCLSTFSGDKFKAIKPSRHLTDTDVVIRHLLTRKKYKRLLPSEDKHKYRTRTKKKVPIRKYDRKWKN